METSLKRELRQLLTNIISNMILMRFEPTRPNTNPLGQLMLTREHLRLFRLDYPDIFDQELRSLLPSAERLARLEVITTATTFCQTTHQMGTYDTQYPAQGCHWALEKIMDETFFPESRSSQWCREDTERRTPKSASKPASFPPK